MNTKTSREDKKTTQEASSWMENPALAGMDMSKLALLNTLANQGAGKSPQEMLSFLLSAVSQGKSKGMEFNSQEMETIIQVLKMGKSPQEVQRMEKIIQMMKLMR